MALSEADKDRIAEIVRLQLVESERLEERGLPEEAMQAVMALATGVKNREETDYALELALKLWGERREGGA